MQILTAFALLIPAFSLVYNSRPLTLSLHLVHNAPLPNCPLNTNHLCFVLSEQFRAQTTLRLLWHTLHITLIN